MLAFLAPYIVLFIISVVSQKLHAFVCTCIYATVITGVLWAALCFISVATALSMTSVLCCALCAFPIAIWFYYKMQG